MPLTLTVLPVPTFFVDEGGGGVGEVRDVTWHPIVRTA